MDAVIVASIVGSVQGAFPGGSTVPGHVGAIPLTGVDLSVQLASGTRDFGPLTITKPMDAASVRLLGAWDVGEQLAVTVTVVDPVTGGDMVRYALTGARVTAVSSWTDESTTAAGLERVSLAYTGLELTHVPSGSTQVVSVP